MKQGASLFVRGCAFFLLLGSSAVAGPREVFEALLGNLGEEKACAKVFQEGRKTLSVLEQKQLLAALEIEQEKRLRAYEKAYTVAARTVLKAKVVGDVAAEVAKERTSLRDLVANRELSAQDFPKAIAIPLRNLGELFAVSPEEIGALSPQFLPMRKKMETLILATDWVRMAADTGTGPVATPLEDAEFLAATSATPMPEYAAELLRGNDRLRASVPMRSTMAIRYLNVVRTWMGREPLRIDPSLHKAAQEHAEEMAELGYYDAYSPTPGNEDPNDRAKACGTSCTVIGLGKDTLDPALTVNRWLASSYLLRLLESTQTRRVAIGYHKRHWVLLIGE